MNRNFRSEFLSSLMKPHFIMITGVILSFGFWVLPELTIAGKGFQTTNASNFYGWVVLGGWYTVIVVSSASAFWLGSRLGSKSVVRRRILLEGISYYQILVIVALIGVGYTYVTIVGKMGVASVIAASTEFSANALKNTLYENYQRGVLSLRYVSILAFGVGLFRFLAFRKIGVWSILAFLSLFANAFVSSRMSLVWALLIGVGMYLLYSGPKKRMGGAMMGALFGFFFVLLVIFTVTRTYNTYRSYGVDSMFAATVGEVQRYLAAPFEGGLSVASNMEFVHDQLDAFAISGIDSSLTTNSAFFQMFVDFQEWAFLVIAMITFFSSFVMGLLTKETNNYLLVGYFVLLYPYAEIWRGNIFYAGITIVLMVFSLMVPLMLTPVIGVYEKRHFNR